jgi:DNA-binding response OmpR family regulator
MARILVIDDEDLPRRAIVRMLATAGHDVREANGGAAGLGLWHDGGADLVLTDVAMPDMTGFELIGSLRAEGATVPIIAMSGGLVVSDLEMVRHAKSLGAVLLGKPFSWDQLTAAVNAALLTEV